MTAWLAVIICNMPYCAVPKPDPAFMLFGSKEICEQQVAFVEMRSADMAGFCIEADAVGFSDKTGFYLIHAKEQRKP